MSDNIKIIIKKEFCKGCEICVKSCVRNVLALDKLRKVYIQNQQMCIGCGRCEDLCPDFAIAIESEG